MDIDGFVLKINQSQDINQFSIQRLSIYIDIHGLYHLFIVEKY